MHPEKILVIDDELEMRELLSSYLKIEGFDAYSVENGEKAIKLLKDIKIDLIILDIMMRGMDGFEVLKLIRERDNLIPIVMVTAKKELCNKVFGLGLGADDYITKPFSQTEFIAIVKRQLKRSSDIKKSITNENKLLIEKGIFKLDKKQHAFYKNCDEIKLSKIEFNLINLFLENPNRVFCKKELYDRAWNDDYFDENTIMVYIKRLRDKLEDDPKNPKHIETVWGVGYKFIL